MPLDAQNLLPYVTLCAQNGKKKYQEDLLAATMRKKEYPDILAFMSAKKILSLFSYALVRSCCYPLSFLSYKTLHKISYALAPLLFYTLERYRKRTLSNLSLSDLPLKEKEKISLAKRSLGNLLATTLDYSKLSREKQIHKLVTCVNPEEANAIMSQGKGLVFLCGHQANWELFFLEGTARMPGVAIGQPVQNSYLYRWILSIRQKFGGLIVPPEQAIKESLKALKHGKFLGIVGDQGMPSSGFSSLFLGRKAWTSPLPALLSYRTGTPLITATMKRENGRYLIHYSPALWPDKTKSMEEEIPSLMERALLPLEESIRLDPEQWLWQHNRWKQQVPGKIKKQYRHDAIAVILPNDPLLAKELALDCTLFREFYPTELLTFFTPFPLGIENVEEYLYQDYEELLQVRDYRFKLVFNLTPQKNLSLHFKKLAALKTVSLKELACEAKAPLLSPLKTLIPRAICHAS